MLRVASLGRDAQNDEASIHFPRVDLNFKGRGPQSYVPLFCGSLPKHAALFNTRPQFFLTSPYQGSDLSSLGRLILKKQGLVSSEEI